MTGEEWKERVETAAIAIWRTESIVLWGHAPEHEWDNAGEPVKDGFRTRAEAALSALGVRELVEASDDLLESKSTSVCVACNLVGALHCAHPEDCDSLVCEVSADKTDRLQAALSHTMGDEG